MSILSKSLAVSCMAMMSSCFAAVEPDVAVKTFYQAYLSGKGNISEDYGRFIDPELVRSLMTWRACNDEDGDDSVVCPTECIKFACNYNGIWIDASDDYFTKTDKWYSTWPTSIRTEVPWEGDGYATVNLLIGNDPDPFAHLKLDVHRVGEQWKIMKVEKNAINYYIGVSYGR